MAFDRVWHLRAGQRSDVFVFVFVLVFHLYLCLYTYSHLFLNLLCLFCVYVWIYVFVFALICICNSINNCVSGCWAGTRPRCWDCYEHTVACIAKGDTFLNFLNPLILDKWDLFMMKEFFLFFKPIHEHSVACLAKVERFFFLKNLFWINGFYLYDMIMVNRTAKNSSSNSK